VSMFLCFTDTATITIYPLSLHDALPILQAIGQQSMLELIEDLSEEQQQVLTLKFVFNFPNADVATILGKTEGAVKSLQHRALVSDRKSTRLNSSHLVISYAVFCLKKKNL